MTWSESLVWTIEQLSAGGSSPAYWWADAGPAAAPHQGWLFAIADVQAFVRIHNYALHTDRMLPGHPLTHLAKTEDLRQAWRTAVELAAYLGVNVATVRRAANTGLIPHRRRPGAGSHGEIRVQAKDFAPIAFAKPCS